MTREEAIIRAAENNIDISNFTSEDGKLLRECFIVGAKWADQHPNNVWHDANEKPRTKEWILAQFDEDDYDTLYFIILSIDMWCDWCKTSNVIQWAYISDLLPKGGEK